ncbi:ap2/erf and b3 domain-containing transcription factor at1g50680 [Phtheirospermum japonicum]|uniref:Ap2/erf and b3 domain-containing transcription factor at1g50680 n=1 Tax=Phtheirospermum japonicum TaxID=374723 RepID=A0A830DG17_9LAMI|nr:ap2/erf and b3 domain-containing transcription factor at1g50680 [Phtheirospermum japonicum]
MEEPRSSDHSGPSKYKGVVAQPNGHWGAQIYSNQQRIWLGTFKSEMEAALAYDSAAIKLRDRPTPRNVHCTDATLHEPSFQAQFSTETILSMIKDGSYAAKFSEYLTAQAYYNSTKASHDHRHRAPSGKLSQLFQKELTPSDVSKLNRLVIPKKQALRHFPRIPDVELNFFDRLMRSWKLRYCYWKSSQSFVFTRGWNRFAKDKGLRAKDRVIFSSYERDGLKLFIIDVAYCDEGTRGGEVISSLEELEMKMGADEREETKKNELETMGIDQEKKVIRLFGFQIQIDQ